MNSENAQGAPPSLGEVVADVLELLEEGRLASGYSTPIGRGSAIGTLEIKADPDNPTGNIITVRMAILRDPETGDGAFYRRLLELNGAFEGRAAFSVDEDGVVWLSSGRPAEDLDPGELLDILLWTANRADELDDQLLDEFGREWAL